MLVVVAGTSVVGASDGVRDAPGGDWSAAPPSPSSDSMLSLLAPLRRRTGVQSSSSSGSAGTGRTLLESGSVCVADDRRPLAPLPVANVARAVFVVATALLIPAVVGAALPLRPVVLEGLVDGPAAALLMAAALSIAPRVMPGAMDGPKVVLLVTATWDLRGSSLRHSGFVALAVAWAVPVLFDRRDDVELAGALLLSGATFWMPLMVFGILVVAAFALRRAGAGRGGTSVSWSPAVLASGPVLPPLERCDWHAGCPVIRPPTVTPMLVCGGPGSAVGRRVVGRASSRGEDGVCPPRWYGLILARCSVPRRLLDVLRRLR